MKRVSVALRPLVLRAVPFALALAVPLALGACGGSSAPRETIQVTLTEWQVSPPLGTIKAGRVRFLATNKGTLTHELAVLSIGSDGQMREVADVEDVEVGESGAFTVDLKPGRYQLACLIAAGQAGSTVDHYQSGMHADFTVIE